MKNFRYNLLIISLLSVFIGACSSDVNDVVNPGDRPIVQAYLVPNQPVSMTITQEISYSITDSVASTPINNLSIKVTDEKGVIFNLKGIGNGVYQSAATEKVQVGKTYSLAFTYNNRNISATTSIPAKPLNYTINKTTIARTQINLASGVIPNTNFQQDDNSPIEITWTNPNNDYFFVVVDNLEVTPVPIVILPTSASVTLAQINRRFRQEPVQGSSDEVRPQSFQYYGKHNIILFRVNADYAALYKSNGTTTQNINTPPSTITNGLGLFTGVNADTLSFTVTKR